MIVADISELERIVDTLTKTSNEIEDVFNKTKATLEEMSANVEFLQYLQAQPCIEIISDTKQLLFSINERIQEIKNIMVSVPNGYLDREREYKNELSRMASYLGLLSTTATAVLSPDFPTINSQESSVNQDELQKMVAGSAEDLKISNIAAISKTIEKEYPVKRIQEMEND